MDVNVYKLEEIALYVWFYKYFVSGELSKLVGEECDKSSLENEIKLSLWCVQYKPPFRPSMKRVVSMLEGTIETAIPPCPSTTSA